MMTRRDIDRVYHERGHADRLYDKNYCTSYYSTSVISQFVHRYNSASPIFFLTFEVQKGIPSEGMPF